MRKLILAAGACFALALSANAQSFDCSKAKLPIEKNICDNAVLRVYDSKVAEDYRAFLINHPLNEEIKTSQRAWLKQRNECNNVQCAIDIYLKRIFEIDAAETALHSNSDSLNMITSTTLSPHLVKRININTTRPDLDPSYIYPIEEPDNEQKPCYGVDEFEIADFLKETFNTIIEIKPLNLEVFYCMSPTNLCQSAYSSLMHKRLGKPKGFHASCVISFIQAKSKDGGHSWRETVVFWEVSINHKNGIELRPVSTDVNDFIPH